MSAFAETKNNLFTVVPAKDPTYTQLSDLAKAELITEKEAAPPLTRFEVAQRLLKAEEKYKEIAVAAGDMEIPAPPEDNGSIAPTAPALQGLSSPSATQAADEKSLLAKARKSMATLKDAYQYEINKVKESLESLEGKANGLEADQFDLWKHLQGMKEFPSISIHGLGRASGTVQQYSGAYSGVTLNNTGSRSATAFLDLEPTGIVSKEVRWNANLRVGSDMTPNGTVTFLVRKITLEFNPPWLSSTFGNFEEAYTPFTLWNRNSLDLRYKPDTWARQDDLQKYESFLNHEPYWPLAGVKVGTAVAWPNSDLVEKLKLSGFAHMITNGLVDSGWLSGPNLYTDWLLGGTVGVKSQKWYSGTTSFQASLDTYGLILDEALGTDTPGASYNPLSPSTWAHQYVIGSVRPDFKVGIGDDVYVGAMMEYAYADYEDDQRNPARGMGDLAFNGGTYLQFGDSKISFNYMNVGEEYYSPLAQTRQDAVTNLSNLPTFGPLFNYFNGPELFQPMIRGQYFLQNVPRPGGIFSFYDRTQDNTFPYGLATPNRQGGGLEIDIKTLKEKALKFLGSAYLVKEIGGNFVLNSSQATYVPVDSSAGTTLIRNFTYINMGPSLNFGPLIGFDRDLELGANVRWEQTTSALGNLDSFWFLGGIKIGILPVWDISAAFSQREVNGTDEGYGGSLFARYSYLFDNSDLGQYSAFTVNGSIQGWRVSNVFKVNANSRIFLDFNQETGTIYPVSTMFKGSLVNQFAQLSYDVLF